ncbi:alginate lyase family protein [Pseudonocardia sp. CA-107938]|uniref:heparinase II/III family protein n=1 Tax=Pseudonocardia sp. CA-107938 TaxID=3240021 RepID=UPI003D914CA9
MIGTTVQHRLSWYRSRALAMSPREVAWRLRARAGAHAAPVRDRLWPVPVLSDGIGWAAAYDGFRRGSGRPVLLDAARVEQVVAACPRDVAAVVAAADTVREHRFGFFGEEPVGYPDGVVDWNLDPRHGVRWPHRPAGRIDHRSAGGDPKWIWELNRLQHLPWLAQAWLVTGDAGYAEAALADLDGFIEQNPVGWGIAWRGGFEAGVRAISVAVALQGLRDAPAMNPERYRRAVTMLAASADRSWRERSLYSSANNHLLGELVGIVTIALLHPELDVAQRLGPRASAALAREAERQILPDGMGAEQSAAYQVFAADLLLVPTALRRLRGAGSDDPISAALRRSAAHLRSIAAPGEPAQRFGDDDGGFALRLHADPLPSPGRHLAAVAAVAGEAPAGADLAAAWLGGTACAVPAARPAPPGDRYARDGGFVVLRRGSRRICMDVGPLGYLALAAHGHADALAVTLADGPHDLIGDPGTGSYYGDPAWRAAFRGTRMHATASVDDRDQSEATGPFLWGRKAVTTVLAVDLARGVVDARHDGYAHGDRPVTHRRWLVAPPSSDVAVVVDLFTGVGEHRLRTSWPLHPDLDVRTDGRTHVGTRDGATVSITAAATVPVQSWAVRGDEEQRLGWWSTRFESWGPAWLVGTVADGVALPAAVATVLATGAGPADLTVTLEDEVIEVRWAHTVVRIDARADGSVAWDPLGGSDGGNAECAGSSGSCASTERR